MAIPAILAALGGSGGGGAAGGIMAALGGSGGASGVASSVGQVAGQLQSLKGAAGGVAPSLKGLVGHLTAVPRKILEVKEQIVGAFDTFVAAIAAPIDAIQQMGNSIGRFVKLSSPATFDRFVYSVENTFATIGRILEPIMRKLTEASNKVGDAFAKLEPAFRPTIKAVGILIDVVIKRFGDVAEAAAPIIQRLGVTFLILARVIEHVERVTRPLIKVFGWIQKQISALLGLGPATDPDAKQATAVRDVRFSSTDEIQKQAAVDAIKASFGGGESKEDQANNAMISLPGILNTIKSAITDFPGKVRDIIMDAVNDLLGNIGAAITGNLPSLPGKETLSDARGWAERQIDKLPSASSLNPFGGKSDVSPADIARAQEAMKRLEGSGSVTDRFLSKLLGDLVNQKRSDKIN